MFPLECGQFFQTENGHLYMLVNTGRCPMLIGVESGNRWSDGYDESGFREAFKITNQEEWNRVTSNNPEKFRPIDVRIEGFTIIPDWEA